MRNKIISDLFRPEVNFTRIQNSSRSGILFITSYPPRECGIATYSRDLIRGLNKKFSNTLSISVCALESGKTNYQYPDEVTHVLDTLEPKKYEKIAAAINKDKSIQIVVIQHEFGFFKEHDLAFLLFLQELSKPVVIVFHTVLPRPDGILKAKVKIMVDASTAVVVMTKNSADILAKEYGVISEKISVIAHGTHMVPYRSDKILKMKYGLNDRKILSTFGLLSSGKSLETTIEALPAIVRQNPEVLFLVIGKTHPEVVKKEGEKYRNKLESMVKDNNLTHNVLFINKYLELPELLEYLQLTDVYLFTSNDPNQAVSGTFAYAMSCGCAVVSTPIPHAREMLTEDAGILFDFQDSRQLSNAVMLLLNDEQLRRRIISNSLQRIASTSWENSAIAHIKLFGKLESRIKVRSDTPVINLNQLNESPYRVEAAYPPKVLTR